MALALQGPSVVRVGRVSAVYWPGSETAAVSLAEYADGAATWPGIGNPPNFSFRMILTPNKSVFDSVTAGRLPGWGAGAAFPNSNTIVIRLGGDVRRVLTHELAHLTLRNMVGRVPRWFDEGYASRAAGEWDRLEALRVNWQLVRGDVPSLIGLNRDLRAGATRAGAAYALATTAVLSLERLGKDRGLEPILSAVAATSDFDRALRRAYGITFDQFELHWRKELRSRYGWLLLGTSFSMFWTVVAGMVLVVWARRRRRDRVRRLALDDGWILPDGDDLTAS